MKKIWARYLMEGLIWSAAGTIITLFFDNDFILWETSLMWFLIGIVWEYWMMHPIKYFRKNNSKDQ
jgi:hypothetical protein